MKPSYTYSAKITRVVDGDTFDADVDLGFDVIVRTRFRLYGIDTAEKNDKNEAVKKIAIAASEFTKTFENKLVVIKSLGKDKYGRWLAVATVPGTLGSINEQLIEKNLAKEYFGDNKINLGWGKDVTN